MLVVRTSDYLLRGIPSKNPLRKKPRSTALTVSRGHVNDEDALVRFVELLEGVAKLFEVVPPFHVEVGG